MYKHGYYADTTKTNSSSFSIGDEFGSIEVIVNVDRFIEAKEDANWFIGVGGSIYAEPLIQYGMVYFGCCDKNFYAVKESNGEIAWKFPVNDIIISKAAICDNIIYFTSFDGCIYALSLVGNLVWKFDCGDKINSDVCLHEDLVYFGSHNGNVYSLNRLNGDLVWKFTTHGPISSSPSVNDGILYVGSNDKNLYAIDAYSGTLKWRFSAGGAVRYKPAFFQHMIIVGSLDGVIYAVDRKGSLAWKFATKDGISTNPLVFEDSVFVGSRDMNYYQIDADGKLLWKFKCVGYPNDLMVAKGKLYIVSCSNGLEVLDLETRNRLYNFMTNGFIFRVVEHEGSIIFGSWDCNLYSINQDGELQWKCQTSISGQSQFELPEMIQKKSAQTVWNTSTSSEEKASKKEDELNDYGEFSGTYIKKEKSDYKSSGKRGYIS